MNIREDVIYARQSVDRKDSISIESQIDFCKYELKGSSCRVFKDKGYSGKNTDRPEFQKLLGEIRKDGVTVKDKDGNTQDLPCDSVIISAGYIPSPVFTKGVHVIGDAKSVGSLRTVIWQAWDVAMKL